MSVGNQEQRDAPVVDSPGQLIGPKGAIEMTDCAAVALALFDEWEKRDHDAVAGPLRRRCRPCVTIPHQHDADEFRGIRHSRVDGILGDDDVPTRPPVP